MILQETLWKVSTYLYTSTLGLSIGLLTLSLWCNFILTRRLNQYTAGVMQVEMHQNGLPANEKFNELVLVQCEP